MAAVRRMSMESTARWREDRLQKRKGHTKDHYDADALLAELAFAPRTSLRKQRICKILNAAARRNDTRFFIRLGKVLVRTPKTKPARVSDLIFTVPAIHKQFLIANWIDSASDKYVDLCRLTSDGLLAVLQHKFGRSNVRVDVFGVTKIRQRLGLKVLRHPKTHVILVGDELRYLD